MSGWSVRQQAGTLIVAVTMVVWAAGYFPREPAVEEAIRTRYGPRLENIQQQLQALDAVGSPAAAAGRQATLAAQRADCERAMHREIVAAQLEHSLLGRAGKWVAPLVRPLGWDWRSGCAVIASFPARDVVIGTLGVIYHLGDDLDESSDSLAAAMKSARWPGEDRPVFTVPVALSIMVFFAFCCQCAATIAAVRRETNSWRWPIFTFSYMTGLAYLAALATHQLLRPLIS